MIMRHRSKIVLLCLVFFLFSLSFHGYAILPESFKSEEVVFLGEKHSPKDELTFIVELEGEPIYSENRVSFFGTAPSEEENAQLENMIEEYQHEILQEILENDNVDAKLLDSYSLLFNGFSMKGSYASIEALKKIPGVENVYICDDINLTIDLADSVGMSAALPESIAPYSGKGQVVAIIDNGFNVDHEFFKTVTSDAQYTKDDIAELVADTRAKELGTSVYKSSKIPFAYDYYHNDTDVLPAEHREKNHGTHVAGIAGGKNGKYGDKTINGVAPDCQLLLMKIASDDGTQLPLTAFMAAMEDAVALKADVINCSVSLDYASPSLLPDLDEMFANAHSRGVFVAVSAGNKGRGFNNTAPLTTNIDYSASGVPAALSTATSVGAVNKNYNGRMYSLSSYGVSENLELKPDITAPGGNGIISSFKDGTYGSLSGTSMASPHIAGAAAVINEYLDKEGIKPDNKAQFIQNLMMSTAEPTANYTSSNPVPYSPRLQGAGVVNVAAAVKTSVILTGDSGKSKISLGDEIKNSFDIKFTASNFGSESITYDKLSLTVLTDGYYENGGKYYVGESKFLTTQNTLPESVTVEANSSTEITVNIVLDEKEAEDLLKVYTNGFFIDGFIRLETKDKSAQAVGIPFTGFYGDWTKASVYDNTIYEDGGSYLGDTDYDTVLFSWVKKDGTDELFFLGSDGDAGFKEEYIALSPNGDGICDSINILLTPMRTISHISSEIIDQNSNVLSKVSGQSIMNKFSFSALGLNNISSLKDGDYTLRLTSLYNYQKSEPTEHVLEFPFYVDTEPPETIKAVVRTDVVDVTFHDNRHLSYAYSYYKDNNGKIHTDTISFSNPENDGCETLSFELSKICAQNADYNDIYICVYDKAGNCYKNSVSCLTGDIHPVMTSFSYSDDNTLSVDFDLISCKATQNCTAMLAFYDSSGCLAALETKEKIDIINGKSSINFEVSEKLSGVSKLKLFFWNSKDDIIPVDTAKTFSVTAD